MHGPRSRVGAGSFKLNCARPGGPRRGCRQHAAEEAVLALKSIYDKPFLRKSLLLRLAVAVVEHAP
ncbi:hypothetical protein EV184_111118 [Sinorhizobium americanum]|uniref:Uncharacterized protein n=1 Tax=Sinorhizobium americanum TaxID=194963 RepID=A0A4R2BP36_9HYPH|nr:hypothetical protein EV184_111118 [Sinorhizobium americanum]